MPPRRRRAVAAAPAVAGTSIEELPDSVLSSIFTMAGPVKLVGPAVNATCTRFRQALLGDPERWCSFELALPQLWSNREAWLAAKLGLLHQVAGLVESFAMEGVEQLQDWAKNCRGGWSLERFLSRLDPQTLTGLRLEGLTGRQAPLAAAGRFEGLTALELSSSSARLPKNTGAVVGALTELRHLSLYSWGGTAGASRRPRLTPLPDGVVSHALPQLSQLTYLQLGALHVPAASQLTCLSPTLQLLSLFDQDVPAGGLPSPPARADWPLLASYSADWDFSSGNWGGKHVGGCRLAAVGCTLTYGATTSATGRAVDVAAEVTAERVAYYEAGGTLQGLLNCLLPAGAALTQLTLQKYSSASAAELASLRAPALSELEALTLQACAATSLLSLCESSPHLTRLSASGFNHYSRPNAVSAAMAALPLRQVQLHGVNLPDLPAGRWLEELEELSIISVHRLPMALAGTAVRRLALDIGSYGSYNLLPADVHAPTVADVDNSLLLMPRLECLNLTGPVSAGVLQHLREQAPHLRITTSRV